MLHRHYAFISLYPPRFGLEILLNGNRAKHLSNKSFSRSERSFREFVGVR